MLGRRGYLMNPIELWGCSMRRDTQAQQRGAVIGARDRVGWTSV